MKVRLLIAVLSLVLLASMSPVRGEPTDLLLNEVCPVFAQGISDEDPGAWFELYNASTESIDTDGLKITDAELRLLAVLPMVLVPPGGMVVIHLGVGADDLEGLDGRADFFIGRTAQTQMSLDRGALATFRGKIRPQGLRDFVAWGDGPLEDSPALGYAVARGKWSQDAFVDLSLAPPGSSFGFAVAGLDRDAASPWSVFTGRAGSAAPSPGTENDLCAYPLDGEVVPGDGPSLAWVGTDFTGAETYYYLNVDRYDAQGGVEHVVEDLTQETQEALPSQVDGQYVWTIEAAEDGQVVGGTATRTFFIPEANPLPQELVDLQVPFLDALKDTGLLCLYDLAGILRPGCGDTHWNVPHSLGNTNDHDAYYSARASIAMINRYYGGDLSQDRISYEIFKNRYPGGEGDLGHGVGFTTIQMTQALRWALGGVAINYAPYAPPFDYLRTELDQGHPILIALTPAGGNREAAVIAGYAYLRLAGGYPPVPGIKVLDPRTGRAYWILYSFYSPSIQGHWQITGAPAGILQEASIAMDSDADGIVDFDESPEFDRLGGSASSWDTDGDLISDFFEVYCYTFHDAMHPGHGNDAATFSDPDADGDRSESDADSDGAGIADGMEDLDHDGIAPEPGETCPYDPTDGGLLRGGAASAGGGKIPLIGVSRLGGGSALVRFRLPDADRISLDLYGPDGRLIRRLASGNWTAGQHEIVWNGSDEGGRRLMSGVYMLRLATERQGGQTAKLIHLP